MAEGYQHLGRFAEAEIAAPVRHVGGQFFHCAPQPTLLAWATRVVLLIPQGSAERRPLPSVGS